MEDFPQRRKKKQTKTSLKNPALKSLTLSHKKDQYIIKIIKASSSFIVKSKFMGLRQVIKSKKGPFCTYQDAESALNLLLTIKLNKGYKITSSIFPEASHTPANQPSICTLEIFSKSLADSYLQSQGYDICCYPVSNITDFSLAKARSLLQTIENYFLHCVSTDLLELSQAFYAILPHFLQNLKSSVIDSIEKLKQKEELIADIVYFQWSYKREDNNIKCFEEITAENEIFKLIQAHIISAVEVSTPKRQITIQNLYKTTQKSSQMNSCWLLWVKLNPLAIPFIVENGFIIPDDSTSIVYPFNRAVYLSDNICTYLPEGKETYMLLCEVDLGNNCESFNSNFMLSQYKYDSVKGIGMIRSEKISEIGNSKFAVSFKCAPVRIEFTYNIFAVFDKSKVIPSMIAKINIT